MTKLVPFTPPFSPADAKLLRDLHALERLAPDIGMAIRHAIPKTVVDITALRQQQRRSARRRR